MADIIDHANALADRERAALLAARKRHGNQPGRSHCAECGDPIPAGRRAIPGVTHCVECQTLIEQANNRGQWR